ncbi:MAG: hypothetical protein HC888_05115 [Candidatus Competibacteraceae bacterium]|nr:hypothetical protein [Candidatus Competibacteraceae bacterium]
MHLPADICQWLAWQSVNENRPRQDIVADALRAYHRGTACAGTPTIQMAEAPEGSV